MVDTSFLKMAKYRLIIQPGQYISLALLSRYWLMIRQPVTNAFYEAQWQKHTLIKKVNQKLSEATAFSHKASDHRGQI